jgi:hypothetical protein
MVQRCRGWDERGRRASWFGHIVEWQLRRQRVTEGHHMTRSVVGASFSFWGFLRALLLVDCRIVHGDVHIRVLSPLYGMESEEES